MYLRNFESLGFTVHIGVVSGREAEISVNLNDVCVFPYDWRKSIHVSGEILNKKIKTEFLPTGQTIQSIAHAMGGLVTRDLMINHQVK